MTATVHSAEARARARRVRRAAFVRSAAFRSNVRLILIAAYSILFMGGGFFEWSGATETVLWSAAAILWVVIAVTFAREVNASAHKRAFVASHLSLPLLLIAPAFLWVGWWPIVAFVLVVIAYVLDLRYHSAGDGFVFSFGLVLFVGVFAGLSMVELENDNEASSLKTPQDAIFWAFASLFRINYGKALTPETQDGRLLATVVGVCAVLGASLFTATVVGWVVGSRKEREEENRANQEATAADLQKAAADDLAWQLGRIRQELASLRTALTAQTADRAEPSEGTVTP